MEPSINPRNQKAQRRLFYSMTRRMGVRITLRAVELNEFDYSTGVRGRTYRELTIRNAVVVPPGTSRSVTYTAAMMQSIRPFAWQGGAGQDVNITSFIALDTDMREWGEVEPSQNFIIGDKTYEVVQVWTFDGGVLVEGKLALNSNAALPEPPPASGVGVMQIGSTFQVA